MVNQSHSRLNPMNFADRSFSWLAACKSPERKKDSRTANVMYRGFHLDSIEIHVGDFVLISAGSTTEEYYVASILNCFDNGDRKDSRRATVQWYTQVDQIEKRHLKFLSTDYPPLDGTLEVVKDLHSYHNEIDVETIMAKCYIQETPATVDPNTVERPGGLMGHFLVCRFSYANRKPYLIPVIDEKPSDSDSPPDEAPLHRKPISSLSTPSRSDKQPTSNILQESSVNNIGSRPSRTPCPRKLIDYCTDSPAKENRTPRSRKSANNLIDSTLQENRTPRSRKPVNYCLDSPPEGNRTPRSKKPVDDCMESPKVNRTPRSRKSIDYSMDSPIEKYQTPRRKSTCKKRTTPIKSLYRTPARSLFTTPTKGTPRRRRNVSPIPDGSPLKKNKLSPIQELHVTPVKESSVILEPLDISLLENLKIEEPKTPKHTKRATPKSTKRGTPLIKLPSRVTPLKTNRTTFEQARTNLHVSAVPDSLPCREEEFQQIFTFVEGKLLDASGGCMYVSGLPGTGKTATVYEVVRLLEEAQNEDSLPSFELLHINAMKLTKPHQLWVQMWEGLTGEKVTADHASQLLENFLTAASPKRKCIVMILDELDLLWTKKQDVMYNLFDWSSRVRSKLVVVAIANTMDLPERMMISRVSSRLGLTRMTFQPYTHDQLQTIIKSRLAGINAFESDAIQFVARKVAALSGDARRALDICRRATEIVESEKSHRKNKSVCMEHVTQAIQEMFSSSMVTAVSRCSKVEKMLLQAIVADFKRTGLEEAVFEKVVLHFTDACRFEGYQIPSISELLCMVQSLSAQRIILSEHSRLDLTMRIRLNISVDDIQFAIDR